MHLSRLRSHPNSCQSAQSSLGSLHTLTKGGATSDVIPFGLSRPKNEQAFGESRISLSGPPPVIVGDYLGGLEGVEARTSLERTWVLLACSSC